LGAAGLDGFAGTTGVVGFAGATGADGLAGATWRRCAPWPLMPTAGPFAAAGGVVPLAGGGGAAAGEVVAGLGRTGVDGFTGTEGLAGA